MGDGDRDEVRESEQTTIITDGDDRSGATAVGVIAVVLLIVILLLVLFGGWFGGETDEITIPNQVNIDVNVPGPVQPAPPPQAELPQPEPPAVNGAGNAQ